MVTYRLEKKKKGRKVMSEVRGPEQCSGLGLRAMGISMDQEFRDAMDQEEEEGVCMSLGTDGSGCASDRG